MAEHMPDSQGGLPVRMTDLKASVTAGTGMQARHRVPPLQFWSMIMGHSTASRGILVTPYIDAIWQP